jgi:hypothetical protein
VKREAAVELSLADQNAKRPNWPRTSPKNMRRSGKMDPMAERLRADDPIEDPKGAFERFKRKLAEIAAVPKDRIAARAPGPAPGKKKR